MSRTWQRYIHMWLDYAQTHQHNLAQQPEQVRQIQRAWTILHQEATGLDISEQQQLVLDYFFAMDDFFERQGMLTEDISWIKKAMAAAHDLKNFVLVGRLGQDLGWVYRLLRKPDLALEYLILALQVRRKFGPPLGEAATLNMIGVVHDDTGKYHEAIVFGDHAKVGARRLDQVRCQHHQMTYSGTSVGKGSASRHQGL